MKWITIDPGETTGWAVWKDDTLLDAGQAPLWQFLDALDLTSGSEDSTKEAELIPDLYHTFRGWEAVVCEDWALYPWELKSLGWDKCRTARGIGAIELLCRRMGKPLVLQPAAIKETAVLAGAEELFQTPRHENRHANDAIMHGTYRLAMKGPGEWPTLSQGS